MLNTSFVQGRQPTRSRLQRANATKVWRVLAGFALPLALAMTGCMTSPGDGFRVDSWTSEIDFQGFSDVQGDVVTIKAFNFNTNTYENVATATSNQLTGSFWGSDWYSWSTQATLAARFWKAAPSGSGAFARVVAETSNRTFFNYRALDALSCILLHLNDDGMGELADDCVSLRLDMYIYTDDYEHGSPGCSSGPPTVKDHYNVTEIPACKRADIGALIRQKITHPFVLKHYDHDFINHNLASGPNSFFRGHREYIRRMQNHLSVFGEKWLPDGRVPFWTPNTTIPTGFREIAGHFDNCVSTSPGCSGWLQSPHANLSPGIATPSALSTSNMCSQNPTVNALFSNLVGWHNNVHVVVGGSGGTFSIFDSPAATIFWPWHKYVDDLYQRWKNCGFSEPP